jgi:isopenicillin N synthase-like dioxygenase
MNACNDKPSTTSSSNNIGNNQKCTCPPFPIVDISSLPMNGGGCKIQEYDDVAQTAQAACESHGCFHLLVDSSFILAAIVGPTEQHQKYSSSTPSILNRIRLPLLDTLFQPQNICTHHEAVSVFRGAGGESGNAESNMAEPKQSWEYSRCICPSSEKLQQQQQQHPTDLFLSHWTSAVHQISLLLAKLLRLPKEMIANTCEANYTANYNLSSSPTASFVRCNYDLLRLFRYDPVSTANSNTLPLGSSDHTDWGTLTIVWQDTVGGLQIYCPKHNRYNDVALTSPSQGKSVDTAIPLFVHVGDFLCLAKGFASTHDSFIWPSPKHRVISPKKEPRFSLVYFAYPEPQVTLAQAIELMQERRNTNGDCTSGTPGSGRDIQNISSCTSLLKQLSLLCNQSPATSNNASTNMEWDAFQHLHHKPFASNVIPNKWSQVQRTANP